MIVIDESFDGMSIVRFAEVTGNKFSDFQIEILEFIDRELKKGEGKSEYLNYLNARRVSTNVLHRCYIEYLDVCHGVIIK